MIFIISLYPFVLFWHLIKHWIVLYYFVIRQRIVLINILKSILCCFSEIMSQIRTVFNIFAQWRFISYSSFTYYCLMLLFWIFARLTDLLLRIIKLWSKCDWRYVFDWRYCLFRDFYNIKMSIIKIIIWRRSFNDIKVELSLFFLFFVGILFKHLYVWV